MTDPPPYRCVDVAGANQLMTRVDIRIFDVRDAAAFAHHRLPRAQRLSDANLGRIIETVPKSVPLLIYCYHGHASRTYAEIFTDFHYAEVYSLDGGYEAWAAATSG